MKLKSGFFVWVLVSCWILGSVLPAWGQIRPCPFPLARSFLLLNVMTEQGGLYAQYVPLHVGEEPTLGREILLKNNSLLMLYSARVKDRLLLDEQVRLLEEHFLDARSNLLLWRLDGDLRPVLSEGGTYANAPGDSLRVIEALFAASEVWGGETYRKLAHRIGDGLREHNVAPDGTLRAFALWTPEGAAAAGRGQAVVFAHLNLVAIAALAREDPSWEGVAAKSLRILLSGVTGNGLFYFSYFPQEGRYEPGEGNLIHMAQAALHLGTYGRKYGDPASIEAARRFLAFVRDEYTSRGKIPARYDPVTGEPTVTWENVAVYALIAQLAFVLGETEFAATILEQEVLPRQQLDPESPVYGAFTMSFSEAYTYDTLEVLLALTYLARCAVGMEDELIRAVWYIGWEQDSYAQHNVARDLRTLQARLRVNYIGLFAIVYQAGKTSSNPHRDPTRTVSDDTLRNVIAKIHRLGMGVILLTPLFPDDGTWKGAIRPDDLDQWFDHWREILLHYAQLAEETGVEILLLGTELTTLQGYADRWNELIVAVRGRFRGRISYSTNFWPDREHFRQVYNMTQWQNLDFIGVTGYFEIATRTDPTIAELEAGWRNDRVGQDPVADLEALSRKFGKPVVFWEIGYQSRDGTSMYPWNFLLPGRDDEREQADAWTAFLNVFEGLEWFGGYGIFAELVGLPEVPMMYTVLGKEAERVLARHCRCRK